MSIAAIILLFLAVMLWVISAALFLAALIAFGKGGRVVYPLLWPIFATAISIAFLILQFS